MKADAAQRFRIEAFPALDSTSTELKRRAEYGVIDGLVIVAGTQTAGRGRHGRSWFDAPGGSLLFSVGWRAPLAPTRLAGLSLAAGVAIASGLEAQGVPDVQLKWPNDLLHRHCKFAGILIETVNPQRDAVDVIIGIGINLHLPEGLKDKVASPITSLADAGWTGSTSPELLYALLAEIGIALDRFARGGFAPFRAEWVARHALHQRNVTIWSDGRPVASGRAIDVGTDGELLVHTVGGVKRFTSGESTLRAD